MKNIHILPTDKPSRLCLSNNSILTIIEEANYTFSHIQSVNIYITSDEEIKEGDWFICLNTNIIQNILLGTEKKDNCKKIILTTDRDLIKDGVQEIPDEFLEWFVKNPSCEEVEIEEYFVHKINTTIFIPPLKKHTVIIPKEEQTYKLIKEYYGSKPLGSILKHSELEVCNWNEYYEIIPKEEPKQENENYLDSFGVTKSEFEVHRDFDKQETLEEAELTKFALSEAKKWVGEDNHHKIATYATAISVGAKWQAEQLSKDDAIQTLEKGITLLLKRQEKMYSEEEVHKIIESYQNIMENNPVHTHYDEWFEQFKKK